MVAKLVVLIFASFFIQNEACTRLLQRLQRMSRMQQPLRPTGQAPNTLTAQTAPTTISRPETINNPNVLQNGFPNARATDGIPSFNDAGSLRNWNPDLLYSSTFKYRNPLDSNKPSPSWNAREFNAAYRFPRTNSDESNISSDRSNENSMTNAAPRSLVSIVPDLMNAGTGLLPDLVNPSRFSSRLTRIPSDVTSSLSDVTRGMTSSLSNVAPSSVTSTLSSIPNAASQLSSGLTTALSPSNYFATSTFSSIPGLVYLASSFANWMNSNSTLSNTRSNSYSYSILSYIPGLLSAISVIMPFLPRFGPRSQSTPATASSPLSAITSLPGSFLGLTGLTSGSDRNHPYGHDRDSNKRDKTRVRPDRENNYYGDDFDRENYPNNEYPEDREDFKYNSRVDDNRQQHSKKRPSSTQRMRSSNTSSNRRSERNRDLYNQEYDY